MNQTLLTPGPLLDEKGHLAQAGYATSLVRSYDRRAIRGGALRIKEWDYYLVRADKHAVAFTLSDDGYIGMQSATLLVFDEKNP